MEWHRQGHVFVCVCVWCFYMFARHCRCADLVWGEKRGTQPFLFHQRQARFLVAALMFAAAALMDNLLRSDVIGLFISKPPLAAPSPLLSLLLAVFLLFFLGPMITRNCLGQLPANKEKKENHRVAARVSGAVSTSARGCPRGTKHGTHQGTPLIGNREPGPESSHKAPPPLEPFFWRQGKEAAE
nr:hypothetical protein [Pandoravirus massiliensis]